jgi:hypothetical protein
VHQQTIFGKIADLLPDEIERIFSIYIFQASFRCNLLSRKIFSQYLSDFTGRQLAAAVQLDS